MTTQFNREVLKRFRDDLDAALVPLAQKYGITLTSGGGTFDPCEFSMKITGRTANAKSPEQEAAELYDQNARLLKLPPRGTEIRLGADTFLIAGMRLARKNNILIRRKRDNKEYVCSAEQVRLQFPELAAPALTLEKFTAQVNALQKTEVDRLNARPNRLFGAEFIEYPSQMLATYHQAGLTPEQTLAQIAREAAAEAHAEARAS